MNRIIINIDWVPNNFGAAPSDDNIACVATGKTLDEVKKNIVEALRFHISGMREDGDVIPKPFASEWVPVFELTARAELKAADAFITRKALAKETGLNEQQLCHYATGLKKPRPATKKKISDGIASISRRLAAIS